MAYNTFAELLSAASESGSLSSAALEREALDTDTSVVSVRQRLEETLSVMEASVSEGRAGTARSRSGLTGGDAHRVSEHGHRLLGEAFDDVIASALAVVEVNASMGRIVAAPTGGSSGIVPAVVLVVGRLVGAPREDLVGALATAAAVGGVIASRATLSGAAAGCQAEVGSAAAMAAAAATELAGGTPEQSAHAASLALQGLLGLVCDPVGGLVEVPCVARNATGAAVALSAATMALAGVAFPIPFDEVADAMSSIGRALSPALRETALGGLAITPSARRLADAANGTLE